ncbi:hypothetical protein PoB_000258900 [Plakobranchus ocellatus]|uniref:Uncharacterized protein n=1 Tax=Plakobranchus ocellatus TaxID=259542 RepID=A0AAV3Y1J4_9GAST|nr:hypothetical protein PoB_000258900 [Plakobranchus ocellatus]
MKRLEFHTVSSEHHITQVYWDKFVSRIELTLQLRISNHLSRQNNPGSSSRYGPCRRVSTLAVGGRNLEDCFVRGELDRVWVSNPIVLVLVLVVTCKYRLRLVGRRRSESGVMVDRLAEESETGGECSPHLRRDGFGWRIRDWRWSVLSTFERPTCALAFVHYDTKNELCCFKKKI